jgi:hypothetical protein
MTFRRRRVGPLRSAIHPQRAGLVFFILWRTTASLTAEDETVLINLTTVSE